MSATPDKPEKNAYPKAWEDVAQLHVFRTTPEEWSRLIGWRGEMRRKGWKLLRVSTEAGEMIAVFGRTRPELKARNK